MIIKSGRCERNKKAGENDQNTTKRFLYSKILMNVRITVASMSNMKMVTLQYIFLFTSKKSNSQN